MALDDTSSSAGSLQEMKDPYRGSTTVSVTGTTFAEKPPRSEVLFEAEGLINGERNKSYGTPTQNFTNIGEMWTTYLKHKLKDGEVISPSDVADLMILLKIARNVAEKKRDTYVDVAGYAGCGWEAVSADV